MFCCTRTAIIEFVFEYRYKKTSETLSHAGQKASAAFSSVGTAITKKLEDVKYDLNLFHINSCLCLCFGVHFHCHRPKIYVLGATVFSWGLHLDFKLVSILVATSPG